MVTLAFQTAFGPAEIALIVGEGANAPVVTRIDHAAGAGPEARLPRLLEAALAEGGVRIGDVTRIGVVAGPGSFTGLRMGLAFARGLGLVLGCPVLGVSLLEACLPVGETRRLQIALQAQKRPPDITFWSQDFEAGAAVSPPIERSLDALGSVASDILTDRPDLIDGSIGGAEPLASYAAAWAVGRRAPDHPPSPVYVRAPDAVLPPTSA
ncbi:MAG: tRNA (adenosine(37)-N6)-threonylcarbamoyltransferase complex dimerization subunit type 1 TsaB [Pseudomonadota bacterium]